MSQLIRAPAVTLTHSQAILEIMYVATPDTSSNQLYAHTRKSFCGMLQVKNTTGLSYSPQDFQNFDLVTDSKHRSSFLDDV